MGRCNVCVAVVDRSRRCHRLRLLGSWLSQLGGCLSEGLFGLYGDLRLRDFFLLGLEVVGVLLIFGILVPVLVDGGLVVGVVPEVPD